MMKLFLILFLGLFNVQSHAGIEYQVDSTQSLTPLILGIDSFNVSNSQLLDPDKLEYMFGIENIAQNNDSLNLNQHKVDSIALKLKNIQHAIDSITNEDKKINDKIDSLHGKQKIKHIEIHDIKKIMSETALVEIDPLILENNFFFIDLVYRDIPLNFNWKSKLKPYNYFYEHTYDTIQSTIFKKFVVPSTEQVIANLRAETYHQNMLISPEFYSYRADQLPSIDGLQSKIIESINVERMKFENNLQLNNFTDSKLTLNDIKLSKWTRKANTMAQFSQNYVSSNWHQGGSQYISILGILSGRLNYDNKKNIQWENSGEWRLGFNSIEDAVRMLNTNEDVFKINSKFGLKASGNLFYSSSFDFSAQLFNNYKSPISTDLKAAFLTPVRINIGVGLDYKYKKLLSLMLSPLSFKYVYSNDSRVPSTNFGIPKGENYLKQIGSSFKAQFSYSPNREIQIDSKLSFYTNYENVEIDWEIVGNFTLNRYLSTRLSINPRYDNTVILPTGVKAQLQFKELLSFGFSYRLVN